MTALFPRYDGEQEPRSYVVSLIPVQPILDILAEMIAYDSSLDIRSPAAPAGINLSDIPNVGLD